MAIDRTKKGYATKLELERLEKRITNLTGFNITLNNLRKNQAKLMNEQRIIRNEIKAINKRIDKLNNDRGLSGMKIKNE